jgi:hypothetical protein
MFGYRNVRLSKMQFWHFDNRTFGYRGTTVAYIISPCTYLWNTYVPPRKYYWCARARK